MKGFAAAVWVIATYIGLLVGIVLLGAAYAKGFRQAGAAGAFVAVFLTTVLHWMAFSMIEHGHIKKMNEKQ
ncbi:MAG: hypothetical protein K8T26_12400 [Lentisphaerae bacterium]|nr:hypothetical protein [Lentisphaerota bacterium]